MDFGVLDTFFLARRPPRVEADGADEADGQVDCQADGPGAPQCKAPMLWKWRLAPEINPMQYCQYKESCRLQLHVSRHLNPFHPAYMHKKWCRKIDANRQWHGGVPPFRVKNHVMSLSSPRNTC